MINLWVRNYLANGVFTSTTAHGYLMKNLRASFNRAYGLFAFNCTGGRMTESVGWGQGDSAFYVGATPLQAKPKWTKLDHLDGYENVLGYSGTNSKYMKITKSNFYNNGVGVVPNTLDSEPFEPSGHRDHREQQHLLEQLQLLPAELAREDRLQRPRRGRRT